MRRNWGLGSFWIIAGKREILHMTVPDLPSKLFAFSIYPGLAAESTFGSAKIRAPQSPATPAPRVPAESVNAEIASPQVVGEGM